MKFFNLLKKELRDLLNAQTIIGMVITVGILIFMGSFMGNVMDDALNTSSMTICDRDNTQFTKDIFDSLKKDGNEVSLVKADGDDYAKIMNDSGYTSLIIIPEGFTDSTLKSHTPGDVTMVSVMKGTSISSTISSSKGQEVISAIKQAVTDKLMTDSYNLTDKDMDMIENPIKINEVTVVKDKSDNVSAALVTSMTMMQGIVIPIVIFILVIMASQMIVSAIATEKIDKTLETLLSTPVSRLSVLFAKMLAATIVAIINAVVYMLGFSFYMGSMIGGTSMNNVADITSSIPGDVVEQGMNVSQAMVNLGLTLNPGQYVLIGVQMFLTILIALSISMMLGTVVKDVKSTQTVILPVVFAAMIPYIISLFSSINDLPVVLRVILYLIPFTHTYTAMENIMFGNMPLYIGGLIYQVVALIICLLLAVRLFTTDKLFTLTLNFGKSKKKNTNTDGE